MESARDMIKQDWHVYGGVGRDFVLQLVKPTGLWDILPKTPVTDWDDSFCRAVRDTESIPVDRVFREFKKGEHDRLLEMAAAVQIKLDLATVAVETAMNVAAAYHMYGASLRLMHALCGMVWNGNPAQNTESGSYREFKGFEVQAGNGVDVQLCEVNDVLGDALDKLRADDSLKDLEFILVVNPFLIYNSLLDSRSVTDVFEAGGYKSRLIPDRSVTEFSRAHIAGLEEGEFLSSLYIIPISIGDEEPVTYLEYADYRKVFLPLPPSEAGKYFWTDRGLYAWKMDTCGFDVKLSIKNESRLVIKRPDLITRINVKYKLPLANDAR